MGVYAWVCVLGIKALIAPMGLAACSTSSMAPTANNDKSQERIKGDPQSSRPQLGEGWSYSLENDYILEKLSKRF